MDFVTNKLHAVRDPGGEVISYKIEILHQYLTEGDLSAPQMVDSQNFLLNLIRFCDWKELNGWWSALRFAGGWMWRLDGFYGIRPEKSLTNMVRSFLPDIIDKICWNHEVGISIGCGTGWSLYDWLMYMIILLWMAWCVRGLLHSWAYVQWQQVAPVLSEILLCRLLMRYDK